MAYTLSNGTTVQARPGQLVRCDCFGRFLRVEDRAGHGLGLVYRAMGDGTLQRVFGL